jgi:outer membrane protein insertion porin family
LGGNKRFIKWVANSRYFKRLFGDLVFRNSIELGQIASFPGERSPPSERFFLGGPMNMRGWRFAGLGPQRVRPFSSQNGTLIQEPVGANLEMFGLFELEHPIIKEAGIKAVAFFDVGNGFDTNNFGPFELRTCAGLGIRWFSPIGPLRFEWGFPLTLKPGEDTYNFHFFIGTPF